MDKGKNEEELLEALGKLMQKGNFRDFIGNINNALAKSGNKRAMIINLKSENDELESKIFDITLTDYDLDNDSPKLDLMLRFYTQINNLFKDLKKELEEK